MRPAQTVSPAKRSPAAADDLVSHLREEIGTLIEAASAAAATRAGEIEKVPAEYRHGARNLVHYEAISGCDTAALREQLRALGLNPLQGIESCVLPTLLSIDHALEAFQSGDSSAIAPDYAHEGTAARMRHAEQVFGPSPEGRGVRIMVSVRADAAESYQHVRGLVAAGMDIMRINCAHGNPDQWRKMAENLHRAEAELGKDCKILCDLSGPKVRTGTMAEGPIPLERGDTLVLTKPGLPCLPASPSADGKTARPAQVSCSLPEAIDELQVGERVLFDDGKLAGVVREKAGDTVRLEITFAAGGKFNLESRKGINLPNTELSVPALSSDDNTALTSVVEFADIVGLSFTRRAPDIEQLEDELTKLRAQRIAVLLKPETPQAVRDLTSLALVAMRSPPAGLMIPRGDLAIEVGFENISNAQERILNTARAAQIGVAWCTQVLENMAERGIPTRAEMSDVAMGARADCIMLHSAPHIVEAVRFLDSILRAAAQAQ